MVINIIIIFRFSMHYRWSVLNIISGLFLLGCLVFTAFNYSKLSANGGWGIIGMIGLISVGAVALVIDVALQQFIRDEKKLSIIGLVLALAGACFILFY
jgi:hypothetical protein